MPDIQYDSRTGERLPADWRTPKFDTPDMGTIDQTAIAENIKNFGVEEAMKGIEAAVQFQGIRGYQQALKSGESAEKAMARFGPMMFARHPRDYATIMKALTPAAATPNAIWNPANTNTGAPGYFQLGRGGVNVPRPPAVPKPPPPPTVSETIRQVPNRNLLTQRLQPMLSLTNRTTRGLSPPQATKSVSEVLPLPKSKEMLRNGARYVTARGEATWNGEKFVQ